MCGGRKYWRVHVRANAVRFTGLGNPRACELDGVRVMWGSPIEDVDGLDTRLDGIIVYGETLALLT